MPRPTKSDGGRPPSPPDVTFVDKPDVTHGWQPSKATGRPPPPPPPPPKIEEVTWAATAGPTKRGANRRACYTDSPRRSCSGDGRSDYERRETKGGRSILRTSADRRWRRF